MNYLHFASGLTGESPIARKSYYRLPVLVFIVFILCLPLFPQQVLAQEDDSSENQPFVVTVSVGVIDIPKINEPMETFDIDAYLTLQWKDPSAYECVKEHETLSPDGMYKSASSAEAHAVLREIGWSNIIQFTNQVGQREIMNSSLWIGPDGSITYDDRFQATFHSKYDLRNYPFDSQKFHIEIETFNLDKKTVVFEASNDTVKFYESPKKQHGEIQVYELEEWRLDQDIQTYVGEYTSKMTARSYSYVSIDICAHRKSGFHFWKIFLPLILIIAITWSVFWIGGENVASRLSISSIGFLSVISFGFFISNSLPKISYLTVMDRLIIGIYIIMTLTVIEVLTTHMLTKRHKEVVASKLNSYSRLVFPLFFLSYLFVLISIL